MLNFGPAGELEIGDGTGNIFIHAVNLVPAGDNVVEFGASGFRWSQVWATQFFGGTGAVGGVTCTAGTVTAATMTVAGGIVTHC
jgi:hypothetical protein